MRIDFESDIVKMVIGWAIVSTILTAIGWGIYYLVEGPIPLSPISIGKVNLPSSRLWDIALAPFYSTVLVIFAYLFEDVLKEAPLFYALPVLACTAAMIEGLLPSAVIFIKTAIFVIVPILSIYFFIKMVNKAISKW